MRRPGKPGRVAGTPLLIVLAMAQFMVVLDFTIVNVALPSIQTGLHIGTSTLQWLISGYAVSFGGFLLLGGRLADVVFDCATCSQSARSKRSSDVRRGGNRKVLGDRSSG